jgi:hypothetical protein
MARQYGAPPSSEKQQKEERRFGRGRRDAEPQTKKEDPRPPNDVVERFHANASVDTKATDIHHTLGNKPNQAAKGYHTHNGSDSPQLLAGVILTGSKGGNAALGSVISALVKLGATDNTS